jgi:hypothetical protein
MAKDEPKSPLVLEAAGATMLKISNNVPGKIADNITFTLPFEGIALSAEQLDYFMGRFTHRSWYEKRKDGSWHPMEWWSKRAKQDFPIEDEFDCDTVTLAVSGGKELEFESTEAEDDDHADRPAARITSIVLTPQAGGTTLMAFHMQVMPGIGKTNLALQEHQYRPVAITLGQTKLSTKGNKQQQLPLEPKSGAPSTTPLDGSHIAAALSSAEGVAKLTTVVDAVAPDETGHESPPPIQSKGGGAVDAELRARQLENARESARAAIAADHPDPDATNGTAADSAASGGMDPDLENDVKRFEEGAAKSLKEFTNVSTTGVIDGRSERVKHQDRRRGRGTVQ